MKNKKVLIIVGIVILIVAIIGIGIILNKINNDKNESDVNSEKFFGLEINGDLVYYEYSGSSSVERKSMIYKDKNDNWTITTRYFNSGNSKVINNTLNDNQKSELLSKINENIHKNESQDMSSEATGGYSKYATEYVTSKEGNKITPVDLETLGYVQNIYDVL